MIREKNETNPSMVRVERLPSTAEAEFRPYLAGLNIVAAGADGSSAHYDLVDKSMQPIPDTLNPKNKRFGLFTRTNRFS